jgi:hypothetical protein
VEVAVAGARVGGHPVAPGARRLLRPGEAAELQGSSIAIAPAPPDEAGTRVAAAALLRDAARGDSLVAGPRLVVLTGPAAGERRALGADQTVGRGSRAAIRIRDPRASRLHARIRIGPGGATIEDLGSKNGVRLNGVRIERAPSPLHPGDEVVLGDTALTLEDPWRGAPVNADAAAPERGPGHTRGHLAAAALLALSAAALAMAGS